MSTRTPCEEAPEPERFEHDEPPRYHFALDRREFMATLGAGLLVSAALPIALGQERPGSRPGGRGEERISGRLHIGADGAITVLTGKVEVGQGSRTQIAMAAAEELRAPLSAIRVVMADSALVPDDGGTSGSRTTPSTIPSVRRACAAARELLIDAAAADWNADRARLAVREAKVFGERPGEELSFGAIVARRFEKGFEREIDDGVTVAAVGEWKVLGTSVPRASGVEIVTGAHRYPSDVVRPGILHGKVLRPPSYEAKLLSIDMAAAEELDGVTAVRDGDFVGFAAPTSARAQAAMDAVAATARWQEKPQPSSEQLYDHLVSRAASPDAPGRAAERGRRQGGGSRGSVEQGLATADKVLRESYRIAYIQHAPMEPRAAVAEWEGGALTVWTGTQNPGQVRSQLAEAFRISSDSVRVIVPDTGGGFGGKHTGEAAIESARLARQARKPVSLVWSRAEEFTWAYFRPAGVIQLAAGLDAGGGIVAWEHINFNSGASAIDTPYQVANVRTAFRSTQSPLRQGSYRALASAANVFARESFVDELAAAAGADPLELRLAHLGDGRLRDVLLAAARRFGWRERGKSAAGSGARGVGLACGTEKGSFVAACVEVEVMKESGRYRVVEVCQAFECGAIHNPANLEAQVTGAILQGLGGALTEEIRFRDGRILNASFSAYRVPRFRDVPRIAVELVNRPDLPSAGAGETPLIAVAPAVGNALFAASGTRLRSLPLRSESLLPA